MDRTGKQKQHFFRGPGIVFVKRTFLIRKSVENPPVRIVRIFHICRKQLPLQCQHLGFPFQRSQQLSVQIYPVGFAEIFRHAGVYRFKDLIRRANLRPLHNRHPKRRIGVHIVFPVVILIKRRGKPVAHTVKRCLVPHADTKILFVQKYPERYRMPRNKNARYHQNRCAENRNKERHDQSYRGNRIIARSPDRVPHVVRNPVKQPCPPDIDRMHGMRTFLSRNITGKPLFTFPPEHLCPKPCPTKQTGNGTHPCLHTPQTRLHFRFHGRQIFFRSRHRGTSFPATFLIL